jgi:hypothetical protein
MPLVGKKLSGLAVRMGYGNGHEDDLLKDYFSTTNAIREIYGSFFGKDGKERRNG